MLKKLLVTGGNGLIGTAIKEEAEKLGIYELIMITREECDLTRQEEVENMFERYKPDYVIHAAARVGGIGLNMSSPAQQFNDNIMMNTMMMHNAWKSGVQKYIAFSSICAFPNHLELLEEKFLHDGIPHSSHTSYAYAKRMTDIQAKAYKEQYGVQYCTIIPGNVFGKRDNFDIINGHVIPSLIFKCHQAKMKNEKFQVWGTGEPMREFVYSNDIARICLHTLTMPEIPDNVIVAGKDEYKIKEIVEMICDAFEYHDVEWLTDKPNGQMRRPTSKEKFSHLYGDFQFLGIEECIRETVDWFIKEYPNVRK